jgi:hypothetical protein
LLLSATRERSQQQDYENVPISEEIHFDQLLSAVLADISGLSGRSLLVGTGASRKENAASPTPSWRALDCDPETDHHFARWRG